MVQFYFIFLVLCTVLFLICLIPGIAMLALIFTFGLATLILMPLPSVTFLLWALLPAVLARNSRAQRPLLALGLLVLALMLLAPPYLAHRIAARLEAASNPVGSAPLALSGPIGIEIIRHLSHHSDLYDLSGAPSSLYRDAPCFDLCERLLLGGQAAWVRIVLRDDAFGNTAARTQALFVAATGEACHRINPDLDPTRSCVLFAADHGLPPDLTLDLEDDRIWAHEQKGGWPLEEIGIRTATAYVQPGLLADPTGHAIGPDGTLVVFRAQQRFLARPSGVVVFDVGVLGSGDSGGGLTLLRKRDATDPIDLAAAFGAMGLPLAPSRPPMPKSPGTETNDFISPPPDAQDAAYVASMLAVGPHDSVVFSNGFAQLMNGWHDRLRWKVALTDGDRAIFCASLLDSRFANFFWSDQVIRKHGLTCP